MRRWLRKLFGGHDQQPALVQPPPPGMPDFMHKWWEENSEITNAELMA